MHGSISIFHSLFEGGLVDEIHLAVAPHVAPSGTRLFVGDTARKLTLTRHVVTPAGYVLLDYDVVHAE